MNQYSGANAPKNVNTTIKSSASNAGANRVKGGTKPQTQNSVKSPVSGSAKR